MRENAGAVNGAVLERMLGQGGAPALRLLELFDGTGRRLPGTAVDGFEVLAAAVTCCRSSPAARAKLLFEMFDLDANGALSHPELVVLIKCVLVGVARVTHGRPPPLPALRAFARDAFESADLVADGKLRYASRHRRRCHCRSCVGGEQGWGAAGPPRVACPDLRLAPATPSSRPGCATARRHGPCCASSPRLGGHCCPGSRSRGWIPLWCVGCTHLITHLPSRRSYPGRAGFRAPLAA